jgi:hypothetical protein
MPEADFRDRRGANVAEILPAAADDRGREV